MKTIGRFLLSALLAGSGILATAVVSRADVDGGTAANVQDGQNTSTTSQSGGGKSGSAVGGQVSGVVTGGHASIDARNTSKDSDVETGDARGTNSASSFVGQNAAETSTIVASDVTNSCAGGCANIQDGGNRYSLSQTLAAVSGDGVAGQVIGLVAVSGDPSIVASISYEGVVV
jgi:hypothetical protein